MVKQSFNQDWMFYKDGTSAVVPVTLPHDAMLYEGRSADNPSGAACAFFGGGLYHYTKRFSVPEEWGSKNAALYFEGVYQNAVVKLNGREVGSCAYGYSSFTVSLADWKVGGENEIEVIADNSKMPNTRWYSGSGIYRPVWLLLGEGQHIHHQGVRITTLSHSPAIAKVETAHTGGEVEVAVYDGEVVIASAHGDCVEIEIPDAKLWSDEQPFLYRCVVSLKADGHVIDTVTEDFGVRTISWNHKGLFINGKETLLRGGCVHHDNGILGARSYAKSEWRRVRILKEAGYNAIRSSHNPCSEEMLKACDHYGVYVMDESWDMWFGHKNRFDYAGAFMANYQNDLRSMVGKDYNHPSVILYSIGNEVAEPATEKGLSLEKKMVEQLHQLDSTRPVTGGFNIMIMGVADSGHAIYDETGEADPGEQPQNQKPTNSSLMFNMMTTLTGAAMDKMANFSRFDRLSSPALDALDIAGYNYAAGRYPKEGKLHPDRLIFGSETFAHAIARNWAMVKKYPYLIGDFMWTSWDYLGEAGSGAWGYTPDAKGFQKPYPWILADMGVFDILGNPNGELYLAQAAWGMLNVPKIAVRPVNHTGETPAKSAWRGTNAIPSWSWIGCEGKKATATVFSSAARVRLLCNGKIIGTKKVKGCKATFKLPYEPGTLEAISYSADGKEIGRTELCSAQGNRSVAIAPEEKSVRPMELAYVSIQIQGENGIVESNDDRILKISVQGGELLGFGSANPRTEESYISGTFKTYYGYAQAVIRAGSESAVTITVDDGISSYTKQIPVCQEV